MLTLIVESAWAALALREMTPEHMKALTAHAKPAIVRYDPTFCPDCEKLNPFWEMASQHFPPATVWRCSCTEHSSVCEEMLTRSEATQGPNMPVLEAWTGGEWVRYFGSANVESLLQWMHAVPRPLAL